MSKGTFNITVLYNPLTDNEKRRLLFIHAFSGCDTVSAIYRQTKENLLKTLSSANVKLEEVITEMLSLDCLQEEIMDSGVKLFQ